MDFLEVGTPSALRTSMIPASTYKQVTMIIGVVVAMIIMVTLWVRSPESKEAVTRPGINLPSIPTPEKPAALLKLSSQAVRFVKNHF